MSLENFSSKFPADPSIRGVIEAKRNRGKSLPIVLAEELVKDAGAGARELTSRFNLQNTMSLLDEETLRRLPPEYTIKMLEYYAAIIFGVSIVSLEETMVDRQFDYQKFFSRFNLAITGTQFAEAQAKEEKTERLSDERWEAMISLKNQDKTLASFFEEENRGIMPASLVAFIDTVAVRSTIREAIIPVYKERAKFLVG